MGLGEKNGLRSFGECRAPQWAKPAGYNISTLLGSYMFRELLQQGETARRNEGGAGRG